MESKKSKLEESRSNFDAESDSSRDVLSEMNAVAELEQQVSMKNKHIRKLLSDVKVWAIKPIPNHIFDEAKSVIPISEQF